MHGQQNVKPVHRSTHFHDYLKQRKLPLLRYKITLIGSTRYSGVSTRYDDPLKT